jgi:hypothetical protein
MNHSIKSAPFAQRTMVAAAVVALFAAGSAGAQTQQAPYPYAHSPNTNENYITGNLPYGARPNSFDTTYNVCRGTDPACYHNWVDNRQMRVLVYSRTAGPRHGHSRHRADGGQEYADVDGHGLRLVHAEHHELPGHHHRQRRAVCAADVAQ